MDIEYYETEIAGQTKPDKPKRPYLKRQHTTEEAEEYVKLLKEWEKLYEDYKSLVKARREYLQDIHNRFKSACLEENGLLDHPNKEKIFGYVWERHHSDGLKSVYDELEELAMLFRTPKKVVQESC